MKFDSRIFLAGHTGMVGSAIKRNLQRRGYKNLLMRTHDELDLTNQAATFELFHEQKPEVVILAAAKVGGIIANSRHPAQFLQTNLEIQNNVIRAAVESSVSNLLFLGSSCIYPKDCPQPIKEEYLLSGPLEPTNRPYALAKIAGVELCWACNREFGTKYFSVMPTNLYGLGDNYEPMNAHVLPGLVSRIHKAKESGAGKVVVWGSGMPRREFLFSDDLAEACVYLLENINSLEDSIFVEDQPPIINIGAGYDLTINELAVRICKIIGFEGRLEFDRTKPDGTRRKLLDITKITEIGWRGMTSLDQGILAVYKDYLNSQCNT